MHSFSCMGNLYVLTDYQWKSIILIIFIIILALLTVLYNVLKTPFKYPYFVKCFDVSNRQNPDMDDWIDYFINKDRFKSIERNELNLNSWKERCQIKVGESRLQKYRKKQFESSLDDRHAYVFIMTRKKTKYKQVYYNKLAYNENLEYKRFCCNYEYLLRRKKLLEQINYECSLSEWNTKEQRKLLTKELREKIMRRDNYTCQICGKYMPDGVGIEIDHIYPISKGGKTVPSNLQVLCSKCNRSKSDKLDYSNYKINIHDKCNEYKSDSCEIKRRNTVIDKANDYLDSGAYSHKGLVLRLLHDGYTREEAEYGISKCIVSWNDNAYRVAFMATFFLKYETTILFLNKTIYSM